jgi:hypothetical protein
MPRTIIGIALIVIGLVGLAYGGFSFTRREKVVDLGPVEVTRNEKETFPIAPVVGGLLLASGVVVLTLRPSRH